MPIKILAIDDSKTMRLAIKITFAAEDAQVVAVSKGSEAIPRAKQHGADIILIDHTLAAGEPSGLQVVQELKANPATAKIPVILMIPTRGGASEADALAAGADAVIAKPFDTQELIDKVAVVIKGGAKPAAKPEVKPAAAVGGAKPPVATPPAAGGAKPPVATPPAAGGPKPPVATPAAAAGAKPPVATPAAATATAKPPGATPAAATTAKPPGATPAAATTAKPPGATPAAATAGAKPVATPTAATVAKPATAAVPPGAKPAAATGPAAVPGVRPAATPAAAARPAAAAGPIPIVRPIPFTAASAPTSGMLERLKAAQGGAAAGLDAAAVRALLQLSHEVVEQVVWEVVPDLAEQLIKERMQQQGR
jgi:CheY-like chemotaxis protein